MWVNYLPVYISLSLGAAKALFFYLKVILRGTILCSLYLKKHFLRIWQPWKIKLFLNLKTVLIDKGIPWIYCLRDKIDDWLVKHFIDGCGLRFFSLALVIRALNLRFLTKQPVDSLRYILLVFNAHKLNLVSSFTSIERLVRDCLRFSLWVPLLVDLESSSLITISLQHGRCENLRWISLR